MGGILRRLEVDRVGRAIVAERPPDKDQYATKVNLEAAEAAKGAVRRYGSIGRSLVTQLGRSAGDI
jgi:hypothetical protein